MLDNGKNGGDGCADLEARFPHGVFKVDCGGDSAATYQLLLDMLHGERNQGSEPGGVEGQDIKARLQRGLNGQKCLIWLDDVQKKSFLNAFNAKGFLGALLVTGVQCDIWDGLPDSQKVHISHDTFWAVPEGNSAGEGNIASKILASRAANDKNVMQIPPECQVCIELGPVLI